MRKAAQRNANDEKGKLSQVADGAVITDREERS